MPERSAIAKPQSKALCRRKRLQIELGKVSRCVDPEHRSHEPNLLRVVQFRHGVVGSTEVERALVPIGAVEEHRVALMRRMMSNERSGTCHSRETFLRLEKRGR
jgi:hypothetical protein